MGTQQLPVLEDIPSSATSTSQAICMSAAESASAVAVSDPANIQGMQKGAEGGKGRYREEVRHYYYYFTDKDL